MKFLMTVLGMFCMVALQSQVTIANNIYEFGGNLGIGINSPETALRIEKNVASGFQRTFMKLRNTSNSSSSSVAIGLESFNKSTASEFGHTSSTYTSIPDFRDMSYITATGSGFSINARSDYGSIRFYTNQDENGIIERMRITADGNIGIGTSTPDSKLRIEDDVPTGEDRGLLKLRNTNGGDRASVFAAFESNDQSTMSAIGHTSDPYTGIPDFENMGFISSNAKGFSMYSSSDYGSLRFYTNRDASGIIERMRITADGNIGIGTKTPMFPLHLAKVEEDQSDNILFMQHGDHGSKLAQTAEGGEVNLLAADGSNIVFSSFSDSYMNVKDGNFGIGTSQPSAKLEVTDGDVYISDINKGIIMKSPDGGCWRGRLNNDGQLGFATVTCPEDSKVLAEARH